MKIVKKTPKVAACLCDLEVIGEDEKTESECLPTPPPHPPFLTLCECPRSGRIIYKQMREVH